MSITDRNITNILIILIIGYIICCVCTKNRKNTSKLTDHDKRILYFTTIYGYILGIFITCYEVCVFSELYGNNINIRILELIISLIFIAIILYAYTYQDDVNYNWGKVSESLWPLLTSFILVSTLCTNSVYIHFNE